MTTPKQIPYTKRGEPIFAHDWNSLLNVVRRNKPIDSPTIRWADTADGIRGDVISIPSVSSIFDCQYLLSDATEEVGGTKTVQVDIGQGNRRIIGGGWNVDSNQYGKTYAYRLDASGFVSQTGFVICSYQYGVGWDTYSAGPFAIVKQADLPVEGKSRHVVYIGNVEFDSDGNITSIRQRHFQDIEFYDMGICPTYG